MTCVSNEMTLYSDDLANLKLGDEELDEALVKCKTSGSMLPIIKEELRCKIQNRRLTEGHGELKVTFEEPKPYKLTKEEIERRDKRRLNNRLSAMKCRWKKKDEINSINKELRTLQEHNTSLKKKYEHLRKEKMVVEYKLNQLLSCFNSEAVVQDISAEQIQYVLPLAWELFKDVSPD